MVPVVVKLFAFQAQAAGTRQVEMELAEPATVEGAVKVLRAKFPAMPWAANTLVAVNRQYVAMDEPLKAGDELAIIPPVSGG